MKPTSKMTKVLLGGGLVLLTVLTLIPHAAAQTCADPTLVAWWRAEGNANDTCGAHNGTLVGGVMFAPGIDGQAFSFDGVSGEIVLDHTSALDFGPDDSLTIATWVNPTLPFFDQGDSTGTIVSLTYQCTNEVIFLAMPNSGAVSFLLRDHLVTATGAGSPGSIVNGQWRHVVGVRDVSADLTKLYVDGVLVSSITDPTTGTFTRADSFANKPDRIGSVAVPCASKRFYRGLIDEVRIYRRALSDCEIQALAGGPGCVVPVAIDIKPGSFPNSINPRSKGVIPVAILTTDTFDATTVDPNTVRFGATGTEAAPVHSALEDVDGDGDIDLILQFNTQNTGIVCGETSASLTGQTFGGQVIQGSDSIRTVPCK